MATPGRISKMKPMVVEWHGTGFLPLLKSNQNNTADLTERSFSKWENLKERWSEYGGLQ